MAPKRQDLRGRFGHLLVTHEAPNVAGVTAWHCTCDCGRQIIRRSRVLLRGDEDQSCGCMAVKALIDRSTTHDLSFHPLYGVWRGIRRRCNDPKHDAYARYGGRGIKVCERWQNSFEAFLADVGTPPKRGLTLDRRDNDGDYEPTNCRWATRKTQGLNTRSTVWVVVKGETLSLTDAATALGTHRDNLRRFANKHDHGCASWTMRGHHHHAQN
jgi:hypothetical protein